VRISSNPSRMIFETPGRRAPGRRFAVDLAFDPALGSAGRVGFGSSCCFLKRKHASGSPLTQGGCGDNGELISLAHNPGQLDGCRVKEPPQGRSSDGSVFCSLI
jgi:hypothetical protein